MRRVAFVALLLIAADKGGTIPPSPDPIPYQAQPAYVAVLGYMGASQAVNGYAAAGGSAFNATGLYPNVGLGGSASTAKGKPVGMVSGCYWTQLVTQGGTYRCDLWSAYFEPQLGAETAVWLLAAQTDDEVRGGADARTTLLGVVDRIRARTQAPIYVSVPPALQASPACKTLEFEDGTRAAIERLIGDGVVLRGPVLPDLTQAQKLNRCHPNAAGEAVWGQALAGFFG